LQFKKPSFGLEQRRPDKASSLAQIGWRTHNPLRGTENKFAPAIPVAAEERWEGSKHT
jgi:hypothetical protein